MGVKLMTTVFLVQCSTNLAYYANWELVVLVRIKPVSEGLTPVQV